MKALSQPVDTAKKQKLLILVGLYSLACAIMLSGVLFGVYSMFAGITFKLFGVDMPGLILGLMVAYFGMRSFVSVNRLRPELLSADARFSWGNFRREKDAKPQRKSKNR